jgi:hypothetical protein
MFLLPETSAALYQAGAMIVVYSIVLTAITAYRLLRSGATKKTA